MSLPPMWYLQRENDKKQRNISLKQCFFVSKTKALDIWFLLSFWTYLSFQMIFLCQSKILLYNPINPVDTVPNPKSTKLVKGWPGMWSSINLWSRDGEWVLILASKETVFVLNAWIHESCWKLTYMWCYVGWFLSSALSHKWRCLTS